MPMRSVDLTEHYDSFIAAAVEGGRYSDASEVLREGLRLLEQREEEDRARVEWLRGAAQDGIDALERGEGIGFASMDDLAAHVRALGDEVSAELAAARPRG